MQIQLNFSAIQKVPVYLAKAIHSKFDELAKSPRARHCEGEARSNLPLPGERRSVASAFLRGDKVPKRGRLLRLARNDEYTGSFCTFVKLDEVQKVQNKNNAKTQSREEHHRWFIIQ